MSTAITRIPALRIRAGDYLFDGREVMEVRSIPGRPVEIITADRQRYTLSDGVLVRLTSSVELRQPKPLDIRFDFMDY